MINRHQHASLRNRQDEKKGAPRFIEADRVCKLKADGLGPVEVACHAVLIVYDAMNGTLEGNVDYKFPKPGATEFGR